MSITDGIVALLLILFAAYGIWRGIRKSLAGVVSALLAFVLSAALAAPISGLLYDRWLNAKISALLGGGVTATIGAAANPAAALVTLTAQSFDLNVLKDVTPLLRNVDPAVIKKLDPAEMQRLVNWLCSSVCKNRTISTCITAYNKKYGTSISSKTITNAVGVSGSFVIPAAISLTGMQVDIKNPLIKVQAEIAKKEAAASAAAASKAAASKKASAAAASKASAASGSPSATTSRADAASGTFRQTTSKSTSSRTSRPESSKPTSSSEAISEAAVTSPGIEEFPTASLDPQEIMRTLAVKLLTGIVLCVSFALLWVILWAASCPLRGIFRRLRLERTTDRLLGGLGGVLTGILVCAALLAAFVSPSPVLTDEKYQSAVNGSVFARAAYAQLFSGAQSAGAPQTDSAASGGDEQFFDNDEQYFTDDDEQYFE